MRVTIEPGLPVQKIAAPPSKSAVHRLLICAGLADGTSTIGNVAMSEDIKATISCLGALGAAITEKEKQPAEGADGYKTLMVSGTDPLSSSSAVLQCNESGSTLRFLTPVAALSGNEMVLKGSGRLMERPMDVYEEAFRTHGLSLTKKDGALVTGGRLTGGEFTIPGDVSSQFVSGLLMALPLAEADSVIRLSGRTESRPYIDMTMDALKKFGVETYPKGDSGIRIPGSQKYRAHDVKAEADWSNAAYLMALGAEVSGLDENSLQGDRRCVEYYEMLREGCAHIDISDCPDLGPALMAYAALNYGCILSGVRRLRFKESDRGSAMKEELAKFGTDVEVNDEFIKVGSGVCRPSEVLCSHNDHRIVMALAAICARTGGSIEGTEAVRKSFPDYFDLIGRAGVCVRFE